MHNFLITLAFETCDSLLWYYHIRVGDYEYELRHHFISCEGYHYLTA